MTFKNALSAVPNVLCVICAGIFIWNYAHRSNSAASESETRIEVGKQLDLPTIHVTDAMHTALIAVSTTCPYCRASGGFYKRLADKSAVGHFKTVAILPESVDSARPFFSTLGITRFSDVQEANFGRIGIKATPTLMILDSHSRVEALWVGKLNPVQESEVFAKLGMSVPSVDPDVAPNSPAPPSQVGSSSDIYVAPTQADALLHGSDFVLVDVRPRSVFDGAHLDGALNIPLDEFSSRAAHELPTDKGVLIYCGVYAVAGCSAAGEDQDGIATSCHAAQNALAHLKTHYERVRYLATELSLLSHFGGKIIGTSCN